MSKADFDVWAIVPAAGRGRRFRAASVDSAAAPAKQLARLGDRSMLAAVLDTLDASRVAGVVVVVNADVAPAIEAERPPTARRVYILNPDPDGEMIESVQIGLARAGATATSGPTGQPGSGELQYGQGPAGFLVCPGDHPAVTTRAVDVCLAAFAASSKSIVLATCDGRRGHPLIVPADLADVVATWPSTARLNELRTRFADRVLEVETSEPGVLTDVDVPEDLAGLR
ncbi:MAG: NTP transferase domain-containing protein [Phycisphaerae bacterium]|nr:NTP transferase domain-containing protein [Phycisphaerae bacterium]